MQTGWPVASEGKGVSQQEYAKGKKVRLAMVRALEL